jgi:hypothetical protein
MVTIHSLANGDAALRSKPYVRNLYTSTAINNYNPPHS